MSVTTQKYVRKPFMIDAVQVTKENMDELAEWCKGTVYALPPVSGRIRKFIDVPVQKATHERQKRAFCGDWLLFSGKAFKVYTEKAFTTCFELASGEALLNSLPKGPPIDAEPSNFSDTGTIFYAPGDN